MKRQLLILLLTMACSPAKAATISENLAVCLRGAADQAMKMGAYPELADVMFKGMCLAEKRMADQDLVRGMAALPKPLSARDLAKLTHAKSDVEVAFWEQIYRQTWQSRHPDQRPN